MLKWLFCTSRIPKIDFTVNLTDRKIKKFPHCDLRANREGISGPFFLDSASFLERASLESFDDPTLDKDVSVLDELDPCLDELDPCLDELDPCLDELDPCLDELESCLDEDESCLDDFSSFLDELGPGFGFFNGRFPEGLAIVGADLMGWSLGLGVKSSWAANSKT